MPPTVADYGRETQHDPSAFWNSTGRHLFNQVMSDAGYNFDNIGIADLEGDNSLVLMSEFVSRCCRKPPVSRRTNNPHGTDALQTTVSEACRRLKSKFSQHFKDLPDIFPEEEVKRWRKAVKDNHNRSQMRRINFEKLKVHV